MRRYAQTSSRPETNGNCNGIHNNHRNSAVNGGHYRSIKAKAVLTRRGTIAYLGCAGLFFLVGVHMYLFTIVLVSPTTPSNYPNKDNLHLLSRNANATITSSQGSTATRIRGGFTSTSSITSSTFEIVTTPLRPIDREFYTVRINTWRRPQQLIASVLHHASCEGALQVQIVWCDKENEPPVEIADPSVNPYASKVVIEKHDVNSLNERFHLLLTDSESEKTKRTTTMGILSIDDDVLRPCEAIDAGFFRWVHSPHRMVGFDARTHVEEVVVDDKEEPHTSPHWTYGYLSTTQKENLYSMSLTRYCFVHRDYMTYYMEQLPRNMLDTIAANFNCEDIAMSFLISSLTGGQPPLLADTWARNTQMKLNVDDKISGGKHHKQLRDECVDSFAQQLGLKDVHLMRRLKQAPIVRNSKNAKDRFFDCGAKADGHADNNIYGKSSRELQLEALVQKWKMAKSLEIMQKDLGKLMQTAGRGAYEMGLLGSAEKRKKNKKSIE